MERTTPPTTTTAEDAAEVAWRRYLRRMGGLDLQDLRDTLRDETLRRGAGADGAWLHGCRPEEVARLQFPSHHRRGTGAANPYLAERPRFTVTTAALRRAADDATVNQGVRSACPNPECGKANAATLARCNKCGTALGAIGRPAADTPNQFTAVVHGVAIDGDGRISVRYADARTLCFDTRRQLTMCHYTAVPTTEWVPDWTHLLRGDPRAGVRLVRRLVRACARAFVQNVQAAPEVVARWSRVPLRLDAPVGDDDNDDDDDDTAWDRLFEALRGLAVMGFNLPPSQEQMHLQFLVPPWTPFHYGQYLRGVHLTHGRFFPVDYVLDVLRRQPAEATGRSSSSSDDQVWRLADDDERYHTSHRRMYEDAERLHLERACWSADRFAHFAVPAVPPGRDVDAFSARDEPDGLWYYRNAAVDWAAAAYERMAADDTDN